MIISMNLCEKFTVFLEEGHKVKVLCVLCLDEYVKDFGPINSPSTEVEWKACVQKERQEGVNRGLRDIVNQGREIGLNVQRQGNDPSLIVEGEKDQVIRFINSFPVENILLLKE